MRFILLSSLGLITASALAESLPATSVERIKVTGSHISRIDLETPSPLSVISKADIEQTGVVNIEDLLQRMSFSAGVAGNATNAYWTSGGYGTAQVNLRGLGIKRTLVLIDGKRVVNGGTGANSAADLNMLPTYLIERIEVLKDGASAIYGADAVAGVVNIITRKDIDALEIIAKAGISDKGDGEHQTLAFNYGQQYQKGSFAFSASYINTQPVLQSDRINCAQEEIVEKDGRSALSCLKSSTTIGGRGLLADGSDIQFNQTPGAGGNSYENYNNQKHGFRWIDYLNAVNPSERINLGLNAEYYFSDQLKLDVQAMYANRTAEQIITPRSISGIKIDKDFRYNPTGQDFELIKRRNIEFGAPYFFQDVDSYRFVAELTGQFSNNWEWSSGINYGRNTGRDGWTFDMDKSKIADTLDHRICSYETDASIPCGDWFGVDELSQQVKDYVLYQRNSHGGNQTLSITANIQGDLLELPAGTLAFAAGLEHRKEKGWRTPNPRVIQNGFESVIDGRFSVNEAFAELSVPIVANQPWAEKLDAQLALRYTDYSTFGSETNYKLGLTWQLNQNWMLRGVRSTAFRTPMLTEQFGGTNGENLITIDPCVAPASADIKSHCAQAGIPDNFKQDGNTIFTAVGGNPDIGPETAETHTFGLVWQSSQLSGLTTTLDYFKIEVDNAITSVNGSDMLRLCYTDPGVYALFCSGITRHPLNHQVTLLEQRPVNAATEEVSGVDLEISYRGEIGGFPANIQFDATRLLSHHNQPLPDQPQEQLLGMITEDRGNYAKWRANLSAGMTLHDWHLKYGLRLIGKAQDVNGGGPIGGSVPSIFYSDVQLGWQINDKVKINLGVENLFDKQAPFLTSWNDANTDVMTYDLHGRRAYLDLYWHY